MTRDQYQRNASECMKLAAQMEDPNDKLQLMMMARAWLKLADYSFVFEEAAQIVGIVTKTEGPKEG
jgi:hypothetical protein